MRWVNELLSIPGKGQVSFMELSMDFECFAGRSLLASPKAIYNRATALRVPERARVPKLALATFQKKKKQRLVEFFLAVFSPSARPLFHRDAPQWWVSQRGHTSHDGHRCWSSWTTCKHIVKGDG